MAGNLSQKTHYTLYDTKYTILVLKGFHGELLVDIMNNGKLN